MKTDQPELKPTFANGREATSRQRSAGQKFASRTVAGAWSTACGMNRRKSWLQATQRLFERFSEVKSSEVRSTKFEVRMSKCEGRMSNFEVRMSRLFELAPSLPFNQAFGS